MTIQDVSEHSELSPPISPSVFTRWYFMWHVVYLGGLYLSTGVFVFRFGSEWSGRGTQLLVSVLLLTAVYTLTFIWKRPWPLPWWWKTLYFLITIAVWLNLIQISSLFSWLIVVYIFHSFSILPPAAAIPVVAIIFIAIQVVDYIDEGWAVLLSELRETVVGTAVSFGFVLLSYGFIYNILRTSKQQAALVRQLQEAQRELKLAHQQESELAVLQERERLARDLHDGLGHSLVALSLQLESHTAPVSC